jgi:DNA-binding response OmpR family regulator
MADYRVLIVDDQWDITRMLQVGLETLEAEFDIVCVPSGEEALLEAQREPVDLLISDVRLPGISGLELMQKMRAKTPDLKVILMTGLADPEMRREVADAGAEAFFLKPMDVADFLDAVERSLGIISTIGSEAAKKPHPEVPRQTIADRLASLRRGLDAFSIVLVDQRGKVLVQAGDLPDAAQERGLLSALIAALSAGHRITQLVRQSPPQDLFYVSGKNYDLFLTHVGDPYGLAVVSNKPDRSPLAVHIGRVGQQLQAAADDISAILTEIGVPVQHELIRPAVTVEPSPAPSAKAAADEETLPELEKLLSEKELPVVESEEADAFWESAAQQIGGGEELLGADAITYEQAAQLGLTPQEDEQ